MGITGALVLLAVIWFVVLFIVLPLRLKTQGDVGEIVPGTQPGAPANLNLRRKLKTVTIVAFILWVIISGIIVSGVVTLCDIDWFNRLECAETNEIGG